MASLMPAILTFSESLGFFLPGFRHLRVPDSNQEILAVKKKLEGTNPIPSPKFLPFIVAHNELMRL
jgi:hypothetical protein